MNTQPTPTEPVAVFERALRGDPGKGLLARLIDLRRGEIIDLGLIKFVGGNGRELILVGEQPTGRRVEVYDRTGMM